MLALGLGTVRQSQGVVHQLFARIAQQHCGGTDGGHNHRHPGQHRVHVAPEITQGVDARVSQTREITLGRLLNDCLGVGPVTPAGVKKTQQQIPPQQQGQHGHDQRHKQFYTQADAVRLRALLQLARGVLARQFYGLKDLGAERKKCLRRSLRRQVFGGQCEALTQRHGPVPTGHPLGCLPSLGQGGDGEGDWRGALSQRVGKPGHARQRNGIRAGRGQDADTGTAHHADGFGPGQQAFQQQVRRKISNRVT